MTNMQLEMWKKDLDQGKAISLEMTNSLLEPKLSRGDAVSVRYVPLDQVDVGDIVLCMVGGKASLRQVSQRRHMYGVYSFSVSDPDGQDKNVPATMVLGKMVQHRRRGQKLAGESIFTRLKRMFFQQR